jgi:phosphoserine phosphatase
MMSGMRNTILERPVMSINKEELLNEIIANSRRDRKRLEAAMDGLLNASDRFNQSEEVEQEVNTEVAAAFAEQIAKLGDSLTRVNHELVEIIKADKKAAIVPDKLDPSDVNDVYDEIQPEEAN